MYKAMFGIGAAVALAISPAWAEDEASKEANASDVVADAGTEGKSEGKGETVNTSGTIEAGRDSAAVEQSRDVKTSFEERWLREREGYRDGGY